MKLFAHNKQQEKPSPLSTELVKEFVVTCHRNFDRTKEMLDCNAFTTEVKVNKTRIQVTHYRDQSYLQQESKSSATGMQESVQ